MMASTSLVDAVGEVRRLADHLLQQRALRPVVGEGEAHRRRAVGHGDRLGAVFVALRADVLGRVGAADDHHVLAGEFCRVAEIVAVQHAALERLEAREIGHVGGREMARRDDHVVELFRIGDVLLAVMHGDGEFLGVVRPGHHAHRRVEAHPFAHARFLDAALDVVPQHGARRVGGDRPPEMLLEGVVGEFQAFLGAVRPEVAVHRAVHGVAMLVEAGAPGVVPQPAPVRLLLEADDLGNIRSLGRRGRERPQLGKARWSGSDNGYALLHSDAPHSLSDTKEISL